MLTVLEQAMPSYDFRERHTRLIRAPLPAVWQALTALRLDQLTVTRPLVAIRALGGTRGRGSRSLFTDGPVSMLEVSPPTYAIGGVVARPWQFRPQRHDVATVAELTVFDEPGWTKYLVDFHLEPLEGGLRLTTETRGCSTDARARHRFGLYWALIRPGSGVIRRDMLATIDRIATGNATRSNIS